jgi:hypothetical protein
MLTTATEPSTSATSVFGTLTVYTINPAKQLQNTGKLIDGKTKSVLADLPIWDPIHGHQFHYAANIIDLRNKSDMALYSDCLDNTSDRYNPLFNWNGSQVGKVWIDTHDLNYVPYHDKIIFPNISDRTTLWGKLADWSSIKLYEWTESTVLPSEWDALVTTQATDSSIMQDDKASGTPRKVLYISTRVNSTSDWGSWEAVNNPHKIIHGYKINSEDGYINNTTFLIPSEFTQTNGTEVKIFLNGLYKGTETVKNIIDNTLSAPPTTVHVGDVYTVAGTGTGSWAAFPAGTTVELDTDGVTWIIVDATKFPQVDFSSVISTIHDYDTIDIIQELNIPTEQLYSVPLSSSTDTVQYMYDTPYTEITRINSVGTISDRKYYFWVENKTSKSANRLYSISEAANQYKLPSVAYMFFQNLIPVTYSMPNHYSQVIVRGVTNQIAEDNRYTIRFTKDYSLRDEFSVKNNTFARKNIHREWAVFRKDQQARVPIQLWNKLTEAVTGHPLIRVDDDHYTMDSITPIPSLERSHYDTLHGTVTRIGLGPDQAFSDKVMSINTILEEIQNTNYDLYPISREGFLDTYSFDTADDIKLAMDYIYNSFPYEHINRIFFSVLHDALTLKKEYADIFKTSMVALHGVRLFETADRATDD